MGVIVWLSFVNWGAIVRGLLLIGLTGGYCVGSFVVCVAAVGVLECGLMSLSLLVLFGMKWCVLVLGIIVLCLSVVLLICWGLLCGVFWLFC